MKRKIAIGDLVQNYDYELDNNEGGGHSHDWYTVHINMLFNELCDVRDTLYVFEEVEREWGKRAEDNSISYSRIRSIIYEALPYRIVMGLTKILVGTSELSIEKTINVISQMDICKQSNEVKVAVGNVREYLGTSPMIEIVNIYRDKFFAHLDKECAMSDIRIDPSIAMENISIDEIDKGIELIGNLYKECFEEELSRPRDDVAIEDIVNTFFWMRS